MKLSFADYARHRGCSRAAVTLAVQEGRITAIIKEGTQRFIDVERADMEWEQNTRHDKRVNGLGKPPKQFKGIVKTGKNQEPTKPEPDEGGKQFPTIAASRAIKEAYAARLSKILYETKIGKLVEADKVKLAAFETARIMRDTILNIPNRISTVLASEIDPVKVHEILTKELTNSLEILSNAVKR